MTLSTHLIKKAPLFTVVGLCSTLLLSPVTEAAGLLKPNNASYADLKIKEHHVDVVIEDMYATTTIEQVFHNPNASDLEAIYSFPVPEKAAVGEFSYWINDQPVIGEVIEKKKARQIYEQQKQQGNETALVEKDSYKTFDISVFPVKAHQDIKIKLVYLQNTQTDTGIGRYVYPLEEGGVDEQKMSFWNRNEVVEEKFSFDVKLRTSYPVDGIRLPKHPNTTLQQHSEHEWSATLVNNANLSSITEENIAEESATETTQKGSGKAITLNQDIVIYWRHKPDQPASVDMLAYKEATANRGTFKLTLTPGEDLSALTSGRDWVFILDISGSMQGKFSSLIEGVRGGLNKLNPGDRFKIVLFNNQAENFTQGYLPADKTTVSETIKKLDQIHPGRGTNLYAGLQAGIKGLDSDRATALVLVTDGVANVGTTHKAKFLELLEKNDARLFTFIMGNSANRPLLEEMTRVSNGFAMSISNADDIAGQLMLARGKMTHAAMHDINIEIDGVRSKDLVKPRLANTLYHGQQLTLFGHYYKPGEAEIRLSGTINGQKKTYTTRFNLPETSSEYPELERLWAYAAIEELKAEMDYLGVDKDAEQAIVDTAVEYGLVTDYTSMIVVRDEVFNSLNINRTNQQRVHKEMKARAIRENTPVTAQQHRVDTQKPMFTQQGTDQKGQTQKRVEVTPSRSGSGGGAVSPWLIILLAASITLIQLNRFRD